jgi:hypothetical protein
MAPKILLINYSQRDADIVEKAIGLKVLRGYASEVESYTEERDGTRTPNIKFYSPEAYYECAMTFINLPCTEELKTEFNEKARELNSDDLYNMVGYWKSRGQLLVIFAGDTNIGNLWPFGVPQHLKTSAGNDTRTHIRIDDNNELYELVSNLEKQIKMPTDNYVVSGMKPKKDQYSPDPYNSFGTHWNTYISNANGDYLMTSLSKGTSDYQGEEPGVLIIPSPKKLPNATVKITEFFGDYYGIYTPGEDWQASDIFYPEAKLQELNKNIADIRAQAEADAAQKQSQIDAHKQEWAFLRSLVTEQGDNLVDAVFKVLTDILGLKVTKSDDETEGEPIEDLMITFDDRKISVEVKGTTKPNAPLEYTQQPFQHIARRGHEGKVEAALILNHDMKKDPQYRKDAYTDKDKEALISNLYFIDTRVLLAVAKAVVDGQITQDVAVETLFGNFGRVTHSPPEVAS